MRREGLRHIHIKPPGSVFQVDWRFALRTACSCREYVKQSIIYDGISELAVSLTQ